MEDLKGPEMYEKEQWEAVEAHMAQYFGPCGNVFHEIYSPDIHVDIYIMEPTRSRNYYVLNTICNYDPDIIPLLDSEPGTAWSRGEDGEFCPELYEQD